MKFLDNLENAGKMIYSVDIQKLINAGKLNKSSFYTYISKMLDGDFGSLDKETGYRFLKSIEKGDRDIYGVYGDIVVYYDAAQDTVNIVTKPEFTRYFKADWTNTNREVKESRLSTLRPDAQWKEGQRREIIAEVAETVPEGLRQRALRMGSDGKGVYPYMDYSKIVKTLGTDRMNKFKELAQQYNIPVKKLLAAFTHQHSVQNLNVQNAFDFVVKHAGDPYFAATDSKVKDNDSYDSLTRQLRDYDIIGESEWVVKIDGRIATVRDYEYAQESEVDLDTGDKHWVRNVDYVPNDVDVEDAKKEVDLQFLIDDEFEAIAGYKAMIAKTKNPALLAILTHILKEETEHVEELRAAQAGKYEEAKVDDDFGYFWSEEKLPSDWVALKHYESDEGGKWHVLVGTPKFYEVLENFNPKTGKYEARYGNFVTVAEAQSFLNQLL